MRSRTKSHANRTSVDAKISDLEDAEDEDAGLRDERDFKRSQVRRYMTGVIPPTDATQVFSLTQILVLAYQSTGVIYGDIGTSPLYVYSSTFAEAPSRINLLGALSLILWSVTLMVTVKYVLIILRADNDGEGGTFSTYSLLSKYVRQITCVSSSVTNECRQTSRIEIHAKPP